MDFICTTIFLYYCLLIGFYFVLQFLCLNNWNRSYIQCVLKTIELLYGAYSSVLPGQDKENCSFYSQMSLHCYYIFI